MAVPVNNAMAGHTACWNKIGVWGTAYPRCPELKEFVHCRNCPVYTRAGRALLDRAPPSGYAQTWGRQLQEVKQSADRKRISIVVFRIAEEWLALPVRLFQEVLEMRAIHRVPHGKSGVFRGLVNVRGELQLCVSIGRLLRIDKQRDETAGETQGVYGRLVVIALGDQRFVFPVNDICGIHRYGKDDLEPAPSTVSHCATNYMRGIVHYEHARTGEIKVGCLDEELLFAAMSRVFT